MNEEQFCQFGLEVSREANVVDGLHGYFIDSCSRLHKSCSLFGLRERRLGDVLEIGPFYGYIPFLLKPASSSYTVLEGDDPAAYPLRPLYQKRDIAVRFVDLFECFGPTHNAKHSFDFPSNSFDTVLCWEAMEHFNFNPVTFVRELHRILKPGGQVYITVPNKASFQNILALILGSSDRRLIEQYYRFEDYLSNGKKAFYGFHWREYSKPELKMLFTRAGFSIEECDTFVAFHGNSKPSLIRNVARRADTLLAGLLRRYGTNVYLVARKESGGLERTDWQSIQKSKPA
jgi:SAM-dependent methyltransferase